MVEISGLYNDLKTLCKQWFYDKTESDSRFSATGHNHGNLTNDGLVTTTTDSIMYYFAGVGDPSNNLYKANKLHGGKVIDTVAHSNIGSSANATQNTINSNIDTALSKKITQGQIQGGVNVLGQWLSYTNAGNGATVTIQNGELFHGDEVVRINNSSVSDTSKYTDMYWETPFTEFGYNDVFTFSFYAKGTSNAQIKTYFYGESGYITVKRLSSNSTVSGNDTESSSFNDGVTTFKLGSGWQFYTVTYKLNSTGTTTAIKKPVIRVFGGTDCYVSCAKLERGFNATDFNNGTGIKSIKIEATSTRTKDLNNYTKTGFYYNNLNTDCAYISNLPVSNKAFFLTVENWGGSTTYLKQTCTVYSPVETYVRVKNSGTWGTWIKMAKTSEIPSASTNTPKIDHYYTGTVGTSTKYAREDHSHPKTFVRATGGVTTATYVNVLRIQATNSWQDKPIQFSIQARARQRPTHVSIRLSNTNISSANYSVSSFVSWGDKDQTLHLRQSDTNTFDLIIYKRANDDYQVFDLFSGNPDVTITATNTNYGTTAPSNTTSNPVITATYIGVPDTDVTWNGVATSDSVSPILMATGEDFNANRLAYFPSDRISIQYSTDSGSTWSTYSLIGPENKQRLCMNGYSAILGNNSTTDYSKNQLRITFDLGDIGSNSVLYMITRKLAVYTATNNATGFTCQIQTQTYKQYNDSNGETFSNYGSAFNLVGWSGWNTYPMNNVKIGGNASQTSATSGSIKAVRLLFKQTGGTGNGYISKIRLYGETAYRTPSNYSNNGHIYYADVNQNAKFPNKIIKEGGTSSEVLLANGDTSLVSEYVVGTHGTTATSIWTGTCSKLASVTDGTVIHYYLTSAGTSTSVTLNLTLANGTTTGAKNVYFKGTSRLTTHYPINSIITLVYTTKKDGGAWYVSSANDNNSWNANEYGGVQTKCGGTITSGALAGAKASDKKYYTLSSGLVLDTSYPIVQYSGNMTTSNTSTNQLYNKRYDLLITTTKSMTLTAPNPVYIEGTSYKDGKFTVSSNVLTQSLTNGRFYWLIGFAYDSTHIRFGQYEKIYYYDGTNLAPVVETIDSTYYRYSLSSSKYDVDINDGSYTITAKVVDSQGNPVSGRTLVLLENGNTMLDDNQYDASTEITNSNGIATWEIPIGNYSYNADPKLKWGLFNYNLQGTDVNCQVYIDGWYYLNGTSSSNWALMRNKNYAKLVFRGWHPANDVTTSWVRLGSSGMALDALPYTYFEAIGFVNTTIFYIRVKPQYDGDGYNVAGAGDVEIRCNSGTISKNNDFYLDTMWAISE